MIAKTRSEVTFSVRIEASNRASLRATTHTFAPFSKSSSTTARPMPALPPVTIATRSLIPRFIVRHPSYISQPLPRFARRDIQRDCFANQRAACPYVILLGIECVKGRIPEPVHCANHYVFHQHRVSNQIRCQILEIVQMRGKKAIP